MTSIDPFDSFIYLLEQLPWAVLLCLVYILIETAWDETRTRVWKIHLSCLSLSQPVLVPSQSSWKHVSKSVPSQRKRECLECPTSLSKVLRLLSRSVFHTFLSPFTEYLYGGKFFFSPQLSRDFRELYLSRSSRIGIIMSSFRSQFLESLDEYPRWDCKPGITKPGFQNPNAREQVITISNILWGHYIRSKDKVKWSNDKRPISYKVEMVYECMIFKSVKCLIFRLFL